MWYNTADVYYFIKNMEEKIIIAGFGGQGILFLGKLICQAGMETGFNVTYFPSYGAEVRGGTANCNVILSDKDIASPVIETADTLLAMNELSLVKFESMLNPGGLLLLNSSLIKVAPKRRDVNIKSIPASNIAYDLGNTKAANIVMLGLYSKERSLLDNDKIMKNIKGPLADLNIKAFNFGCNFESNQERILI